MNVEELSEVNSGVSGINFALILVGARTKDSAL